jgi:hypothetical protein
MIGVARTPWDGLLAGLIVSLLFGAAFGAALGVWQLAPTRVDIRIGRRRGRDRSAGSERNRAEIAGEVAGVVGRAVGRAVGRVVWFTLTGIAILVFVFWLHKEGMAGIRNLALKSDGAEAGKVSRGMYLWAAVVIIIIVFGLIFEVAFIVGKMLFGGGVRFVVWTMEQLRSPADEMRAVTAESTLDDDRTAAIVLGCLAVLLSAAAGGLFSGASLLMYIRSDGPMGIAMPGIEFGLMFGVVGGLVSALGFTAWGQFTIVRTWLAIRGKLPWRLTTFLSGARDRNVLRQAGAVYQFRHARLQDHLADIGKQSRQPAGDQLLSTSNHSAKPSLDEFKVSLLKRRPSIVIIAFYLIPSGPVNTFFFFDALPTLKGGDILREGLLVLLDWCLTAGAIVVIMFPTKLIIDRNGITLKNCGNQMLGAVIDHLVQPRRRFPWSRAYVGRRLDKLFSLQLLAGSHLPWCELSAIEIRQRSTERVLVCVPKPHSTLVANEHLKGLRSHHLGGYAVIDLSILRGGPDAVSASLSQLSGGLYRLSSKHHAMRQESL